MAGTQLLAASIPFNALKAGEHGARPPQEGLPVKARDEAATASTLSEENDSDKSGDGMPNLGLNPTNESLDRVRVDSSGRPLTTNQGVFVSDNQNSLKAGLRGPTAARGLHPAREDHALRP